MGRDFGIQFRKMLSLIRSRDISNPGFVSYSSTALCEDTTLIGQGFHVRVSVASQCRR